MEEQSQQPQQKGFFELLSPKSALVVGLVAGVLSLGTLGFILSGVTTWEGFNFKTKSSGGTATVVKAVDTAPAVVQQPTPAPVVPKTNKPKAELFVMSYCPYGLQMEKAYLPAQQLLKNKADVDVKFVYYAMHGKKEIDENTRQYCIQKEQPTKFAAYLQCFFTAGQNDGQEANYKQCLILAGVNESSLNSCMTKTDKSFKITEAFNNQATWLSGQFPLYPVQQELTTKYNVGGSPTLVINGTKIDGNMCATDADCNAGAQCVPTDIGTQCSVGRTPENVKKAICAAFINPPAECSQALTTNAFQAGFGLNVNNGAAAGAGCET